MLSEKEIEKLANERINELDKGLFIVEMGVSKGNIIKIELDAEEGNVAIEDCVSVSRNIEHNLDRDKEDFELSVSSAGLDKPLRHLKQYLKNVGEEVKVQLVEHGKDIQGVLTFADDKIIKVETETKERLEGKKKKVTVVKENQLSYDEIKETRIVISFKK